MKQLLPCTSSVQYNREAMALNGLTYDDGQRAGGRTDVEATTRTGHDDVTEKTTGLLFQKKTGLPP